MVSANTIILDHIQTNYKLKRIAYQIYESNVTQKEVILAGIYENGYLLAKKIKKEVEKISDINVTLCKVNVDKKQPTNAVQTSLKPSEYKNKSIILIDDVLQTGTTLIYGVKHFLDVPLKQLKTVVLVDRNHKKYPIKADYKGISLSTSIHDKVKVVFEKNSCIAILE